MRVQRERPQVAVTSVAPGGGKTFLGIVSALMSAEYCQAEGLPFRPLFLSPPKLIQNWHNDADKFTRGRVNVFTLDSQAFARRDNHMLRQQILSAPVNTIFVGSYDMTKSGGGANSLRLQVGDHTSAIGARLDYLLSLGFTHIFYDESHRTKNSTGQLNRIAAQLNAQKGVSRVLATGTFISNMLGDAHGQLAAADPVLAGGAAFGASEGAATFDDLTRQGVDRDTAMKAAAVSGIAGAAGVALPLVGSTTGRTIALALAGGPGGFMAQQAATREILKRADYGEVAKQFDPFDPTGLLLSTLLPAPFAAIGIRRNIKAARAAAAQEHVDAAMVHNITALADQHAVQQANGEAAVQALPVVKPTGEPAPTASNPPPPDFGRLGGAMQQAREAFDAMSASGKTLDAFLADAKLPDEARNLLIGLDEAAGDPLRAAALLRGVVKEGQQGAKLPADAAADAVEGMRSLTDEQLRQVDQPPKSQAGPLTAAISMRVLEIEAMQPAMPVRTREDGTVVTVAEELAEARRAAAEGAADELGTLDSDLVRVAAECSLTFGG